MTALSSLGITDGTNNPPSEAVPEAKILSKEASCTYVFHLFGLKILR